MKYLALLFLTACSPALLTQVNNDVNNNMQYRYFKGNKWHIGDKTGNCVSFAMQKRFKLVGKGVPFNDMEVIPCGNPTNHAQLKVNYDGETYYLDKFVSKNKCE